MGCFNGSLYIFSFPRSMGKKWTLEVLLIEKSNCIVFGLFYLSENFFFLNSKKKSSDYKFLSGSILSTRKNIDIVVVQWDTTHKNILPHNKIVPRGSHPHITCLPLVLFISLSILVIFKIGFFLVLWNSFHIMVQTLKMGFANSFRNPKIKSSHGTELLDHRSTAQSITSFEC